ncbi:hypothetical protein SLA2020_113160 [Shorea laevis]
MVKDKDLFIELDSLVKNKVKLGNGFMVQSDRRGTVVIQSKRVSFMHDSSHIYDPNGVELAKVDMIDNCFPLLLKSLVQFVYISKVDYTDLWNRRYGHFNVKSLKFMQSNELVRDMPKIYLNDDVLGVVNMESCIDNPFL